MEYYGILLTISTFLFSIFTGFFISRQGSRYSAIRDKITEFDGVMSDTYRQFNHLGIKMQNDVKKVIKEHYTRIIKNQAWDYNFTHKSNTITSIHNLMENNIKEVSFPSVGNQAVGVILSGLKTLQQVRKNMIALHHERIPKFQWILLYFLAGILFVTLSIIPSEGLIYSSMLKGAFASSVVFVFILLKKFDQLDFFEKTVGEESARDVLDILAGKK